MNYRAIFLVVVIALLALQLPTSLTAQNAPEPCEIAFAPAFTAEDKLTIPALPNPLSIQDDRAEADAVQHLLVYSFDYLAQKYDAETGMVFDQNGSLDVRATMISAFIWAERGEIEKAVRAVQSVLDNQIVDTANSEYGNFVARAGEQEALDANWSAFIGSFPSSSRIVTASQFPDRFIWISLRRFLAAAAHRLCKRYSQNNNIAFLSSFVLLEAGNRLQNPIYLQAGWDLWNRVITSVVRSGFSEYNSPNYYKVDLYALGFMTDYSGIPDLVTQANDIRDLLWWSITRHYHAPTENLAGPYSRTFTDRMAYELSGIQPFLFRESLGRIRLPAYPDYERNEQGAACHPRAPGQTKLARRLARIGISANH